MSDVPLRVVLGGYTADIVRQPDGGIAITVYLPLFGAQTFVVSGDQWRQIVEYAPAPP
jgi:hypothetical protein